VYRHMERYQHIDEYHEIEGSPPDN
jgi:hypothetical protein